jgi:hypothetical protein
MKYKVVVNRYSPDKFHVVKKKYFLSRWKYIRKNDIGLSSNGDNDIWIFTSKELAEEFINKMTNDTKRN